MTINRRIIALVVILLTGGQAELSRAETPPRLELPVDCEIGDTCSIQNYFDHDPGPEHRDYACGSLAYDGHSGTDFRVPDLLSMQRGVRVVASAPGRVRAARDEMADIDIRDIGEKAVKNMEAGNAVVIVHDGGWETQYSHLRLGSVVVRPGTDVDVGQTLGMIGMSGKAAFPHVHFEIRHGGESIDPFIGLGTPRDCGAGADPLWSETAMARLDYTPTGLLAAGFATAKPNWKAARRGDYDAETLPEKAPALVFWVSIFGVRDGDEGHSRIVAPNGTLISETTWTHDRTQAQWFGFVGRKRKTPGWDPGIYRGEYSLFHGDDSLAEPFLRVEHEIEIP